MGELKLGKKNAVLLQSDLRQQRAKLPRVRAVQKTPSVGFCPAVLQPQDRQLLIMKHLRG